MVITWVCAPYDMVHIPHAHGKSYKYPPLFTLSTFLAHHCCKISVITSKLTMLFKAGDVVQQFKQLQQLLFIGHWSWREFFCNYPTVWVSLTNVTSLVQFWLKFVIIKLTVEQGRANVRKTQWQDLDNLFNCLWTLSK